MKTINFKLVTVFTLVIMDFMFTYIGIELGIITEGNPFMIWLFNVNFIYALLFKILYTSLLLAIVSYFNDRHRKFNNKLINICFSAYAIINIFHISIFYTYFNGGLL